MFTCCDSVSSQHRSHTLDLDESQGSLTSLLRLIHSPPSPPTQFIRKPREEKVKTHLPVRFDLSTAIPLPILRLLLQLADKYALSDPESLKALREHLLAYAPTDGLEVYGLGLRYLDLIGEHVVNEASQYIFPLPTYSLDQIQVVPSVHDHHRILRLQNFRAKALQKIVVEEDLFPHG
ncbi:unnamed protein product, partial [Mycena citricolor]